MIGPVESAVFTNQQLASVASDKNAVNNRFDMQALANANALDGKDQEVQEVRPAEENKEVDEDREHQRDERDRENERSEKREDQPEEKLAFKTNHILDIKV